MERILTEEERWVVLNALNAAKKLYEADAETFAAAPTLDLRLARQFRMQAEDAQAMYDLIEQADAISLAPETVEA